MFSNKLNKDNKCLSTDTRQIAVGINKKDVYIETFHDGLLQERENVSVSYKRSVVHFCSEENTFEVDGMKFKVTCERIE